MAGKCNNRKVQAMLVLFAEKSLAKANRVEVDEHLRECNVCREDLRVIRETLALVGDLNRANYAPPVSGHPEDYLLYEYAVAPSGLTEGERRDTGLHLLLCAECQAELAQIQLAEAQFGERVLAESSNRVLPCIVRESLAVACGLSANSVRQGSQASAKPASAWERAWSLAHKLNARFWGLVFVVLVLVGMGIWFAMDQTGETRDVVVPQPPVLVSTPSLVPSQIILDVESDKIEKVCAALDKARIPYENENGKINVAATNFARAKEALKAAGLSGALGTGAGAQSLVATPLPSPTAVVEPSQTPLTPAENPLPLASPESASSSQDHDSGSDSVSPQTNDSQAEHSSSTTSGESGHVVTEDSAPQVEAPKPAPAPAYTPSGSGSTRRVIHARPVRSTVAPVRTSVPRASSAPARTAAKPAATSRPAAKPVVRPASQPTKQSVVSQPRSAVKPSTKPAVKPAAPLPNVVEVRTSEPPAATPYRPEQHVEDVAPRAVDMVPDSAPTSVSVPAEKP